MVITTRKQREAIKRFFDRGPLYVNSYGKVTTQDMNGDVINHKLSYREFRKRMQAGHDCIMFEFCGMWVGIEQDGYTHS